MRVGPRALPFGLAVVWMLSASVETRADVKPHVLFTDGAVLQQGVKVPVWGTADDGEEVTVSIAGQTAKAVAKDGRWKVELDPLKAGGPHELTIRGKGDPVTVKDVLVGEVWICSGQSNMQWALKQSEEPQKAIEGSENPRIRLFTVPRQGAKEPQTTVKAKWEPCNPKTTPDFSAVGYYFGRDLNKALDVPIGLINTSYGGTAAEEWTSREVLKATPGLEELANREPGAPQAKGKAQAKNPPLRGPTVLYNAMIAPLLPYAVKGAIWYQGESNAGRAGQYRTLFPAMIANWRKDWGYEFPFLFVQLAPFEPGNANWPELREAQLYTMQTVPGTAMAVITDAGDPKDIHPKKKEPVGARLALAARALAYGEKIEYSGPIFKSMDVDGNKAILHFTHVGSGLEARGGALTGFTIVGEDGKFVGAQAEIQGNTVVVTADSVSKPTAVRYGWTGVPVVNLYNVNGLPATPFRTDAPDSGKSAGSK